MAEQRSNKSLLLRLDSSRQAGSSVRLDSSFKDSTRAADNVFASFANYRSTLGPFGVDVAGSIDWRAEIIPRPANVEMIDVCEKIWLDFELADPFDRPRVIRGHFEDCKQKNRRHSEWEARPTVSVVST